MHQQFPTPGNAGNAVQRLAQGGVAFSVMGAGLPAWAHHPMDGAVPADVWQGLLSGLAHPVIGPDHLAFLLAAALLAAWSGVRGWQGVRLAMAFVGAATVATWLRQPGLELPFAEVGVASSVLVVALGLLWQRRTAAGSAVVLSLAAGALHGWAYGEAVLGAEAAPVGAYLLALALVQVGLLALTHRLGVWVVRAHPARLPHARRITAALTLAVGVLALPGSLLGAWLGSLPA